MQFFDILKQKTEAERQQLFSIPVIQDALRGDIVVGQYVAFLTQAYHHVRHTVPLLMACGSRLDGSHEWLRTAIAEYIEEELGHEEWVLSDIAACGGDADRVRESMPHPATETMVAYAYHQIDRRNPVGFFGMVHVLEGTSTALASNAAATIQNVLGLPPTAFSYLNSHGSLDLEHVQFFASLMNRLEEERDKESVVHCASMIYKLYGDIFRSLPNKTQATGGGK
ncbi:MAG TPA: iron-containing redox enzyme family protein [Oxalicibacterium sp.]|nr:iron-containing redox enzyme family protein [Oxalicibacterium sp.]